MKRADLSELPGRKERKKNRFCATCSKIYEEEFM